MDKIFTLEARSHLLLEGIRDYFGFTRERMRREILAMHLATVDILAKKGVDYSSLGPALAPRVDREEACFCFDSTRIEATNYGREVFKVLLPLLDKDSVQSILCGDLLCDNRELAFRALRESLVLVRSYEFEHASQIYCVYLNNLSRTAVQKLHRAFASFPAYVGMIPATYSSIAKVLLSMSLIRLLVKSADRIIMGHEDDRPDDENINLIGYPFEDFGYKVLSLQSMYYGVFLAYKIERFVYGGFRTDTDMSLNAISDQVLPLEDFEVVIEQAKHGYLKVEKGGKLRKAGIDELSREELAKLIQSKIAANYIYNLCYLDAHGVAKFDLMLEVPHKGGGHPTRVMAALEYKPQEVVLRLITVH